MKHRKIVTETTSKENSQRSVINLSHFFHTVSTRSHAVTL